MPASRHQDHTTSPSASAPFVNGAISVHRIPTRVDDVGQRPSMGQDTRLVELICPTGKAEYFFCQIWTGQINLIRLSNLAFLRRAAPRMKPTARRACRPYDWLRAIRESSMAAPDLASLHPGYSRYPNKKDGSIIADSMPTVC